MTADRQPEFAGKMYTTFEAHADYVVAIIHFGESSLGLRFLSVEQMMQFSSQLFDLAAQVWPDDPIIKELLSE